jgi:type IX secretion system PorP/SprF family membrane protein
MTNLQKGTTVFLLTLLPLLTSKMVWAQQYPVFTQYYFNELVINPAYAGSHVQLSLTAMYRNQWVNFPGAPQTFSFSGHTSLHKGKVGVGLLVNHDKIGSYNNENVYGYYSYKIRFNKGTLSMGLQGGFNFLRVDFSKLDLVNLNDPSFATANDFKPNFGAGLYYHQKNFFVGFSVPFLLNSSISGNVQDAIKQISEARYYFLRSGVIFPLNANQTIKVNPSILVRMQEGQPLSFDFNGALIFQDIVSAGVSRRSGDALISFVDLKLSDKFHFAYSYDLTSSEIRGFSNGSHEFMINYRAKIIRSHNELACPDYYDYGILETAKIKKNKRFNSLHKGGQSKKKPRGKA